MSIEEIKSIKKLKEMLRIEIMDNKYLKECCEKAGFELAKNSFEWDGKPKNLVVYALELNRIIDQLKAENATYKKMLEDEDVQLALTEIRSGERHLWRNKAEKLSKALAEIKEIAEDIEDLFYEGLETGTTYDRVIALLNKISKVEE